MRSFLYKLLFGVIHLISLLPFWLLHIVSDLLFALVYYVIGYRKKLVLKNIKRSFPEKTNKEVKEIRKAFYHHFTDLIVESIKSSTLSQKEFQKRYFIINKHLIDQYYKTGKSIIILSPHTGNWEWVFSLVHILPYEVFAVYQRLTNPYMDAYIRKTRERYGARMIPTKQAFTTVMEAMQRGHQTLTWMAADQACKPEKAKWLTFLHQDTTFHKGFENMARQTNQTVFFLDIKKIKRSFYQLELKLIAEDPKSLTEGHIVEEFARLTEDRIRENPPFWLWSHNRWKHKKPLRPGSIRRASE